MIQLQLLELTDIIQADDWVRPLKLIYDGQSDYLQTSSTYGGCRINRLGWIKASEYIPYWVGKTLKQYYNKKWSYPPPQLEIVRGQIPFHHQEDGVTTWHISKFTKPTKVSYGGQYETLNRTSPTNSGK